jgi:hypothetical protein
MGSPPQYKYYRSMMEQFHMFFMGDLFLDTTVRLGPDKVIRCSRLALGKAAHDQYFGVRVVFCEYGYYCIIVEDLNVDRII